MERENNRKPEELRPITIKAGVIPNANGSALVSLGKTTAIAAVYGPRSLHPRHLQATDTAILQVLYSMVPFSTTERNKPGPSRRSIEISKVIKQALMPAVLIKEFPKTVIDVYINIIQADAGTRTAGINAASVALADAGIPMNDLVASIAVGKIDNKYVLDLDGKEEEITKCDMPIAYMPRSKQITLLQMDGNISVTDIKKIIDLGIKGCEILYEKQKQALKERWEMK
jgi:exosome complex component RRP41